MDTFDSAEQNKNNDFLINIDQSVYLPKRQQLERTMWCPAKLLI